MKITICGSMKFMDKMLEIQKKLESAGHTVFMPMTIEGLDYWHESGEKRIEAKRKFGVVGVHMDKIEKSDAILVANYTKGDIENYIGANTFLEMGFAHYRGKKIFILNFLPDQKYIHEELISFNGVVLDGNLNNIEIDIAKSYSGLVLGRLGIKNFLRLASVIIFCLLLPWLFTLYVSRNLTFSECFGFEFQDQKNPQNYQQSSIPGHFKKFRESLIKKTEEIKNFDPILPINQNWLKPDVFVKNNLMFDMSFSKLGHLNFSTTTISLIANNNELIEIPYGQEVQLGDVAVMNLTGFSIQMSPITEDTKDVTYKVDVTHNGYCFKTQMVGKYFNFILIQSIFWFMATLVLLCELFKLIVRGLK